MTSRQHERPVIFDLDGTLVDSAPGIVASLRHAFSACGIAPPATDWSRLIGPPLPRMLEAAMPGLEPQQKHALIAAYRDHYARVGLFESVPYPGVPEAVTAIARAGRRIYVVTNKPQRPAETVMAHVALDTHVSRIVGGDPTGNMSKPERAVALAREEHLAGSTFLGDGLDDLHAAEQIGARFFLAGWGYGTARVLAARSGVTVLHQPSDLLSLL